MSADFLQYTYMPNGDVIVFGIIGSQVVEERFEYASAEERRLTSFVRESDKAVQRELFSIIKK